MPFFQMPKLILKFSGVPLPPGKPIVQLSAREEPLDENSVTDEINLTWAIPKVNVLYILYDI